MAQFSTTDMYLAAYLNTEYASIHTKVGNKIVFSFNLGAGDMERIDDLQKIYLTDETLQSFIHNLKELRGKVYQLMK